MISREPTIERLAVARTLLLEPFGLDEGTLGKALRAMATHRIDDADLYFQYTRSEGWSLEEGIVKSGSFGIDQGVGVRAVAGEKTAFAYYNRDGSFVHGSECRDNDAPPTGDRAM